MGEEFIVSIIPYLDKFGAVSILCLVCWFIFRKLGSCEADNKKMTLSIVEIQAQTAVILKSIEERLKEHHAETIKKINSINEKVVRIEKDKK